MRLNACLSFIALAAAAVPAHGQLFRAYVASDGNDMNACSLTAPCRLLPAALAAVESGGEIWMLDSANYNAATVAVAKSVTILAVPGALGSLVGPAGTPALTISNSNLKVALRNLVIRPFGAAVFDQAGILFNANTSYLVVQNTNISGFTGGAAIRVNGQSTLDVTDTVMQHVLSGVYAEGGAFVTVTNSRIYGASDSGIASQGTVAGTTTSVTVTDTVIARSGFAASAFSAVAGSAARLALLRTTMSHNAGGFFASQTAGQALGTLHDSAIIGNGAAYHVGAGAVLESHGNNSIRNNGPATGALTPVVLQ